MDSDAAQIVPLFGDDALRIDARFSQYAGWEHQLTARVDGQWVALAVGTHRTWTGSLQAVKAVLEELIELAGGR